MFEAANEGKDDGGVPELEAEMRGLWDGMELER